MHTSLDSRPSDLYLEDRPVCGKDVLFLQQWFNATQLEICFLLGLSIPKWFHAVDHPDDPLNDPTVALLVWLLVTYPETQFLPRFPEPTEVYPLLKAISDQHDESRSLIGKTTFGLLLGREITSMNRWTSETEPRPPSPQVYRLLFVLRNLLLTHGVIGLNVWMSRIEREAEARNLRFSPQMTSWSRMKSPPEIKARVKQGDSVRKHRRSHPEKRYVLTPALCNPDPFGLNSRPVRGGDLTLLRQKTRANIADCCYLLGITAVKWNEYDHAPHQVLGDVSVSLLTWALLTYPETHFLPVFPEPVEVYPAYENAVRYSRVTLPVPETAFSLLLGQSRLSTKRWLTGSPTHHSLPPPARRLLLVLQTLLQTRGVPGFEALVNRACFEATVRGIDLTSPSTTTWKRYPSRPPLPGAPRRGRPPKNRDASEPTPVTDAPQWIRPPPKYRYRDGSHRTLLPGAPQRGRPSKNRDASEPAPAPEG
jgi:hypothetical protein